MRLDPNYPTWLPFLLAHSYSLLRRYDEAIAALQDSLERWRERTPYKNQADLERYIAGLRKAGMK